jgi:broad specificity phosphatase PhoE
VEGQSTRLVLVRHGQHHTIGTSQAHDEGLTALGVRQAELTAAALPLETDDVLVASSLRRAQETARAFGRSFDALDGLREMDFGVHAPSTEEMVEERLDLALWRPEHGFPGGETLRAFQTRVAATLERLVRDNLGRRVVAVTHSGFLDGAIRWAYGATPESDWTTESPVWNASITELEHWPLGRYEGGAPRFTFLVRVGDVSHLPAELVTEI